MLYIVFSLLVISSYLRTGEAHNPGWRTILFVEPGEISCLYENFTETARWKFSFQIVEGDSVGITVSSPAKKRLYTKSQSANGDYDFTSSVGEFKFCANNQASYLATKKVWLVLLGEASESQAHELGRHSPSASGFEEDAMNTIHTSLASVIPIQRFLQVHSLAQFIAADNLNVAVTKQSLIVLTAIVFSTALQIYFTKKLFANRDNKQTRC